MLAMNVRESVCADGGGMKLGRRVMLLMALCRGNGDC